MLYYYSGETVAASGDVRAFLNDDSAFVADTALLVAQAGSVFRLATRNRISISGEIVANGSAVIGTTQSSSNEVRILAGGSVFSGSGYAILLPGASNNVVNAGTIDGFQGVSLTGEGSGFSNSGDIFTTLEAVEFGASSNSVASTFNNSGTIYASDASNAIALRASGVISVFNSGTIQSGRGNAIEFIGMMGALDLTNTGTIQGIDRAIFADRNADVVRNSGTIVGRISLQGGDDLYVGTGGVATSSVEGSSGDDTLIGGDSRDRLDGEADDDDLDGAGGNDVLDGGSGDDRIDGGDGNDVLIGGSGGDLIDGAAGRDIVSYRFGAAVIVDLVDPALNTGNAANDVYTAIEAYEGSSGNDQLLGGTAADTFYGAFGGDLLNGRDGNDVLYGEEDDDVLIGGLGNDRLIGGLGIDTASYATATTLVRVDLALTGTQNTVGAGRDLLIGIESLLGSAFNDQLTGDGNANAIDGGDGADQVNGGDGDDLLTGGAGNDRIDGGAGIDTASYVSATSAVTLNLALNAAQVTGGAGTDTVILVDNVIGSTFDDLLGGSALANVLTGGAGNDQLTGGDGDDVLIGGIGNDTLTGGNDSDTADYSDAAAGVRVRLLTLTAQDTLGAGNDTLAGVESLIGSAFDDQLFGDNAANTLEGGAGDDTINGGASLDVASYRTAPGAVTVDLVITVAQNTVNAGLDQLTLIESLIGSAFGDTLSGTDFVNRIEGLAGNDILTGRVGNDTLSGGDGNDQLFGQDDNDTLSGGNGVNIIDGGSGFDTATYADSELGVFVQFNTLTPTVSDFGDLDDTLFGIDAVIGSRQSDQFSAGAGAIRYTGGLGNDQFVFTAGTAEGDTIVGFSGAGGHGDVIFLGGYGAGATFTQINATQWQIKNAAATVVETLTFQGGTLLTPAADVVFF